MEKKVRYSVEDIVLALRKVLATHVALRESTIYQIDVEYNGKGELHSVSIRLHCKHYEGSEKFQKLSYINDFDGIKVEHYVLGASSGWKFVGRLRDNYLTTHTIPCRLKNATTEIK